MKFSAWFGGLALAAAIVLPVAPARAGTTVRIVRGEITAPEGSDAQAQGRFRLSDVTYHGTNFQRFTIAVRGLEPGDAEDPQFEVVLDDGTQEADLGALHLSWSHTRGWLRFDTRRDTLPEGATSLAGFAGGTVHLRLDGTDVATGSIPAFVDPDGGDDGSDGTIAFGYGSTTLGDASDRDAPVAKVAAWASNSYHGVSQGISVSTFGLESGTYTVVLTGDTTDTLGTFTVHHVWWFHVGGIVVSTREGDTIPGGSVAALAGRGIEIRDADGTVVLSGTMPSFN